VSEPQAPPDTPAGTPPLPVVDGLRLARPHRDALRPGDILRDAHGRGRRLPRFFYEIDSWETALATPLSPHFLLWELIYVDVREAELLRTFPRYVPCAVTLMAAALEPFRAAVDTYVHVAANGGYRSPAHRLSTVATPHCWGTAVNIYRIGDDWLDTPELIERYNRIARETMSGVWARPYGVRRGFVDDQIHLDLGFVTLVPQGAASEDGDGAETAAASEPP
jgi:hypothetical protein